MNKKPDIIQAIKHPKIFRLLFGNLDTRQAWLVFLKSIFGLPMDENELELYRKCTSRIHPLLADSRRLRAWLVEEGVRAESAR
jgi:hypothetical protein